jgi:hypothetical protein
MLPVGYLAGAVPERDEPLLAGFRDPVRTFPVVVHLTIVVFGSSPAGARTTFVRVSQIVHIPVHLELGRS